MKKVWHLVWPDGDPRNDDGQHDFATISELGHWMRQHCDAGDVVEIWHDYEL